MRIAAGQLGAHPAFSGCSGCQAAAALWLPLPIRIGSPASPCYLLDVRHTILRQLGDDMFFNPRIFRLFGADVHLHATFFLFAALFLWLNAADRGWEAAWVLSGYYIGVFASILVHEYGHVFVARLHGIDCRKITLHGLGGLAHLDSAPVRSRDEFLIALAGPVTSVILAGVLWAAAAGVAAPGAHDFLATLVFVNVLIAVFNVIPAYPLDGGQMLHALLRTFFAENMAATVASAVAQVLGAGLAAVGWQFGMMNMMIIGSLLFFLGPSSLGRSWLWRSPSKASKPSEGAEAENDVRRRP